MPWTADDVARVWDARADLYLSLFRDELDGKPYDLEVLHSFASTLPEGARVIDAGCGPCGHVTALLHGQGLDVTGIDLSARCVELARIEHPSIAFHQGDQRDISDVDAIVSYYSLHDQPRAWLDATLAAWARALRPDGRLLIVAKEGSHDGLTKDPLGTGITTWWSEHEPHELTTSVAQHFSDVEVEVRSPYLDEISADRIYVRARASGRARR